MMVVLLFMMMTIMMTTIMMMTMMMMTMSVMTMSDQSNVWNVMITNGDGDDGGHEIDEQYKGARGEGGETQVCDEDSLGK